MRDDVDGVKVLRVDGTLRAAGGGRGLGGGSLGTEGQHQVEQVQQKVTDSHFSCWNGPHYSMHQSHLLFL